MSVNHMSATLSTGPLPYWVIGEGRPLLYLHAAGGPQISPFLEELARSHRVLMPIAPGFEGTPFHPRSRRFATSLVSTRSLHKR
jgi:hypothetical protein